jgi:hypothetical protein
VRRSLLPLLLAGALTGCGGSHAAGTTTPTAACAERAQARALARLRADLAALRKAAARPAANTLDGGPAVSRATDRFLLDVSTAPLGNLVRNRMIDHAAAALVGSCEQCFQALEAARPIPAISQGDTGCPAR